MIRILLITMLFLAQIGIPANEECMDNSKYTDTSDGYDYKKYYHIYGCTCPCERYAQSFKRGRCEECLHYRAPKKYLFQGNHDLYDSKNGTTASEFRDIEWIPASIRNAAKSKKSEGA